MPSDNQPNAEPVAADEQLSAEDRLLAFLEAQDEETEETEETPPATDTVVDEAEDEEEDDETPPPAKRKIKVSDSEEVDEDELVKGYLRQSDYTRKTQAVAEERREIEAAREEREKYKVVLAKLEQGTRAVMGEEPDWEKLHAENPEQFALRHAEWERNMRRLEAIEAEQASIRQKEQVEQQKAFQKHLATEQDKLLNAVPEWKDASKREKDLADIRTYALKSGFTEQELNGIYDHRAVLMLRNSMLLDRARERQAAAGKAKPPVKVLKPGAAPAQEKPSRKKMAEARNNHRRTGTVESAAKLLEQLGF